MSQTNPTATTTGVEKRESADGISLDGKALMAKAVKQLKQRSLTAGIRHQADIFGQSLVGSGRYSQFREGNTLRFRYELQLRTEESATSVRHINTGRFLWIHEIRDEEQSVGRVDLAALSKHVNQSNAADRSTMQTIAIGGLPALLVSLDRNFDFRQPQTIRFQGTAVWAVAGNWNPKRLATILPQVKGLVEPDGTIVQEKLPSRFPYRVFVLLGREDLFPYRIEYRRNVTATSSQLINREVLDKPLLTMDVFRVNFSPKLTKTDFAYDPGDVGIEDRTQAYLGLLKR